MTDERRCSASWCCRIWTRQQSVTDTVRGMSGTTAKRISFLSLNKRVVTEEEWTNIMRLGPDNKRLLKEYGLQVRVRDTPKSICLALLWFALLPLFALAVVEEDKAPEPHGDPWLWTALIVMIPGLILWFTVMIRETKVWSDGLLARYLEIINYDERLAVVIARDNKAARERLDMWDSRPPTRRGERPPSYY